MMRLVANESTKMDLTTVVGQDEYSSAFSQTYHELGDEHVVETDQIERLHANLDRLRDLSGRMNFMVSELSGILKV